ncbi:MAG: ABC transporter permease [Acidobacteriaceae bacterium]|nr:ABC transporter permease [Acidobacteriaceae bacterium]
MRWFRRKDREQDLERELRSDLELEAEEQQERGLSPEEAHYAARRAFGNTTLVKEEVREVWHRRWLEDLFKDVRLTTRQLRKSPGFAATAVLSLAVGIGANTAIFTIINAVLLKSLPVRDPEGLVVLGPARGSGSGVGIPRDGSFSLYSYDLYQHLRETNVFAGLCAVQSTTQTDTSVRRPGWSESQLAQARLVSGNYFEVLGVRAALGRALTSSDDSPSVSPVAVVSFRYWKTRLGADPSVLGSRMSVGRTSFTIIGVAPPEFYGETLTPDPPDFWLPLSADRFLNGERALLDQPEVHWLYLIGRLAPSVSVAQAQSRLKTALQNWLLIHEGSDLSAERRGRIARSHVELTPGGSGIVHMQRAYSLTLRLLLGLSMAVLLITCANVANLLLARGAARTADTSLRLALGASRWRLVRQSLTESLTLALVGGALGLWATSAGTKLLIALFFRGTEYVLIQTSPDFRILAFTLVLSCGAALVFGLLPAFRMSLHTAPVIQGASPGIKGSRLSSRSLGLGAVLIIVEVALSLVVLAGAGTFARSLANLSGQSFGFDRERVLIVNIDTAHAGYDERRLGSLYREMYARLNALPGVKSASFSFYSPFNNCCSGFSVSVEGYSPKPGEQMQARLNRVSPGYFQTLGTKVLLGRTFDEQDGAGSRRVAVVTEEFVRRFLPKGNPIGRRFGIGGERNASDLEIVGVVANAKYDRPREELMPMAFFPLLQERSSSSYPSTDESKFAHVIEVRSAVLPETVVAEVRHVLAEVDPGLPVLRVSTLSDNINLMLNQENVVAALALFFGLVALVLSCLGLYGLMAYTVQRRTSEMGIRMALGASRASVIGMMLREALVQGFIGIAIGIPAALAALRLVTHQLYGVNPSNPKYSVVAALVLLLCLALAAYLPARRASRVDPLIALRYE